MTYSEIVNTVKNLPYEQQVSLIEMLAQSLRDEQKQADSQQSSLSKVRGLLKNDDMAQTKSQLTDDYTNYLIEKYL